NLWWGQNAERIRLFENGELIAEEELSDGTPAAQEFSLELSGRANGSYEYTCELVNSVGTTECEPVTVEVTDAEPGTPMLSHDKRTGEGWCTRITGLWWGTKATESPLYEDGPLVEEQTLAAQPPNAQRIQPRLEHREPGTYSYVAELANEAGQTDSHPLT